MKTYNDLLATTTENKQKAQDFPHHAVSLSLILSNRLLAHSLKSPSLSPLKVPHSK